MRHLFQRITKSTKDKIFRYRLQFLKLTCVLAAAFLIAGISTYAAEASSGLKIYNYATKKTTTYTGKQAKVTLNGTDIGYNGNPGILIDGIALVSFNDIFYKSDIAADCVYDKAKGTITISKYGITIAMKIGSKKATVNGKSVTMPVAPTKIKYMASGEAKVLVPSRFVSETLGLGYTWYNDTNIIAIKKYTKQLSYNNGAKFEYTGIQGQVSVDGDNIDLGSMPSVITNNTAMVRAKKVFADSAIDADYSFMSSKKKIFLSKGNNRIIMTVGSKTALVNDKEVQLDTAPIIVTNCETNASYVMVPGGFTANSLGYDYFWNKTTETSMITTREEEPVTEDSGNTDPELGDSGVYNNPGTVLNEWKGIDTLYGTSSEIHELDSGIGSSGSTGYIYYASREYSNMKNNSETFMVLASSPFGKVTSNSTGSLISITADNMSCIDQTYQQYGITSNLVNTIGTYNNSENNQTTVELEVLPENYEYEISFSADRLTLYITVYKNCLTSATIGVNEMGDYITLTGLDPLKVNISAQSNYIYIDLPEAANGLGDFNTNISGTTYITQSFIASYADKTQIILIMNAGYEYYMIENGNQYTLSFRTPGSIGETDPPVILDKSKYEIVIPKPAEITKSLISDEDFYFNNYFVIRLQGDYTQFFNNNNITYNSEVISNISVSLNSSGETEIKIATSKLQGYEIASDSEAIYVNIGNPRDIYKSIVVLDPGHGGTANGAMDFGTNEKDINLKILYTLGRKYFNSDTSKLKVYYTRTTDVDMSLGDRAAFAKKVDADIFVSLHMNGVDVPGVHGSEVFYSVKNNSVDSAGLRSQDLAAMLNTNIYTNLGTTDRGVKTDNFVVIYKNTVPAVLIELGFLSNVNDYALIMDEVFQEKAAKTIYDTLLQVFEAYPTGR